MKMRTGRQVALPQHKSQLRRIQTAFEHPFWVLVSEGLKLPALAAVAWLGITVIGLIAGVDAL